MDTITDIHVLAQLEREVEAEVREINTMSRIRDKMTIAAAIAAGLGEAVEERADALIARGPKLLRKADEAFTPHEQYLADLEGGINEIEDALRQLSNAPLDKSDAAPNGSGNPPERPTKP